MDNFTQIPMKIMPMYWYSQKETPIIPEEKYDYLVIYLHKSYSHMNTYESRYAYTVNNGQLATDDDCCDYKILPLDKIIKWLKIEWPDF